MEYAFEGGPTLNVPGDFNTQLPELADEECTVWYKKNFSYKKNPDKRLFLHFGAVNYIADVYLNGKKMGSHEGGFTPFQFELTDSIKDGRNTLIVKVNNQRLKEGLPGLGYDWFNYGGITREGNLIETGKTYIDEYFIQARKNIRVSEVSGWVKMNGNKTEQNIRICIPELNINFLTETNSAGEAAIRISGKFQLW